MGKDEDRSANYHKGVALVGQMLGPQFQSAMEAAAGSGAFGADIAAIALDTAFGAVWSRPGLDRKQRSLVTLGILIGTGKPAELKNHVRAALNNGLTLQELQEVLIQAIPYAGFPCVAEATEATVAVLRERGLVDDRTQTAKDRGML